MSTSTPPSTQSWQPGWYDDPDDPGRLRWFDGAAWSTSTLPRVDVVPDEVEPVEAEPVRVAPAQVAQAAQAAPALVLPVALAPVEVARPVVPQPRPAPAAPAYASPTPAPRPAPSPPPATTLSEPTPPAFPAFSFASLTEAEPAAVTRRPTPARRLAGRLAAGLPPWLPEPLAAPLRQSLTTYAARTDLLRDRLTRENVRELVLPLGGAWQASVAACLGALTFLLSLWPLVGLGAWTVTCAFAAWGLLRARREALRGAGHAWFGVACGIGPACTGLLLLAYH